MNEEVIKKTSNMQCITCHQPINSASSGFIVCPSCKTVNVVSDTPKDIVQNTTVSNENIFSASNPKVSLPHFRRKKLLLTGSAITTMMLVIGVGLFTYQHFYVSYSQNTPNIQSNQWESEASLLQQAQRFVDEGKLDEATALLIQIGNDYPAYSKVTDLQKTIEGSKLEIAKKLAEDQAKSQAVSPPVSQPVQAKPVPKPASVPKQTPAPTIAFTTSIEIRGDATCKSSTTEALKLLSQKAPSHYATITKYISIIECATQGSGMFANEKPPRYLVGNATRNAGTVWYAGTIAHDAGHSRLYNDYLSTHPGQSVPSDIWTGQEAERICLEAQHDALAKIGGTQSQLDYIKNVINTQYYNVPYDQRWW